MASISYPLRIPAIQVQQPLGVFYIASIPARALLDTAYSDRLCATKRPDGESYVLDGSQRELHEARLKEISTYINTEESTFPNSIILAANFREDDGTLESDDSLRWRVERDSNTGAFGLIIPSERKLAPIIDGQHRLFGFNFAKLERLDMELVCSVFVDLPKPFQAFLFATINSTQKPVNKSLTYELFGYNIENEPPDSWSPDKLAVFFARKLNSDEESPLKRRILVAAENDFALSRSEAKRAGEWMVSMATVVEGIAKLFSQNPKRDGGRLLGKTSDGRKRSILRDVSPTDKSPMRSLYLDGNDKVIYSAVRNFLRAADKSLWNQAHPESFILKTVGIQALFDILRKLAADALTEKDVSEEFFTRRLARTSNVDFSGQFFQNASGSGRQTIRKCLELRIGLISSADLKGEDRNDYLSVCGIS